MPDTHSAHSHRLLQNLSTWKCVVKSPWHCLKISLRLVCYLFVVQTAESVQWLGCGPDQGISVRFPEGAGISPSSWNQERLRCPSSLLHSAFWGVQLKALLCRLSKFRITQFHSTQLRSTQLHSTTYYDFVACRLINHKGFFTFT